MKSTPSRLVIATVLIIGTAHVLPVIAAREMIVLAVIFTAFAVLKFVFRATCCIAFKVLKWAFIIAVTGLILATLF